MIILIHVILALTSIILASITFFRPSMQKLMVSYGLILGTLATGIFLLVAVPSHLLQSCIMGVSYLAVVTTATIVAHTKLASLKLARVEQN
ncbi:hypothetical protein H7100_01595 [Candidatus Saccharibacteria bacterium]|nr:hypothetical protein [Candidatus Saccharibacteria bacterium]